MATPQWVHFKEPCYGDTDPAGNADTFNRACKTIWSNFTAEHDKDGDHKEGLTTDLDPWYIEAKTYTGDGTGARTIDLTNAHLDTQFVRVWDAANAYTYFRTHDMPANTSMGTNGISYTDKITAEDVGEFSVDAGLNVNLVVFYYVAYGMYGSGGPS
jgi:hypothetical protein